VFLLLSIAPFSIEVARANSQMALFVDNSSYVSAYHLGSQNNVAPLATTKDMISPSGIARDAAGRVYVTNTATNTVTVYKAGADGNVPPLAVIEGAESQLNNPTGIALDASGKIYVLNKGTSEITIYQPLSSERRILREPPIASIGGPSTLIVDPIAIAVDASGNVYVTQFSGPNGSSCAGEVTVYAAGSNGNIAPSAIISGCSTELSMPIGIALDSSGNIYVVNLSIANSNAENNPSITVYSAGSSGNVSPVAVIAGSATALSNPQAIALDSGGDIYVSGYTSSGSAIDMYGAGSKGNVSPTATITGSATQLASITGLTIDSDGNLYALNNAGGPAFAGSITVYSVGATGDAKPVRTITSSFTGIDASDSITVNSTGTIYLTNASGGPQFNGSITIYPVGSYAAGRPIAAIAGDRTKLNYPTSAAVDAAGDISVLNAETHTITTYSAGSMGNVEPSNTIVIGKDYTPVSIAAGSSNTLYLANWGISKCNSNSTECYETDLGAIDIYSDSTSGATSPIASISGPDTGLSLPSAITVSSSGNIYVMNGGQPLCNICGCIANGVGSITVYSPGSRGDARPIETIAGPNTGLSGPYGIALDSNDNVYVLASGELIGGFFCFSSGQQRAINTASTVRTRNTSDEFGEWEWAPILVFEAGTNGDASPINNLGFATGPFTTSFAIGPAAP
jgi:hypothetical protein